MNDRGSENIQDPRMTGRRASDDEAELDVPDIARFRPSFRTLLLAGLVSGAILGFLDGLVLEFLAVWTDSFLETGLWSAAVGALGGIVLVLYRRIRWGPDVSVEVGTILGMLYGILPGLLILCGAPQVRGSLDVYTLVGAVLFCSMIGLLVGAVLDRWAETLSAPRSDHKDR